MTYNIDPAGVQSVLSRVTEAGVVLSTTLASTGDAAEPLSAGLQSPLEPVAGALAQLFDREQRAASDIENCVTAGLNAAVATSLAYFSGDDEMAVNAVRAAQQAAIDGNFDYFITGDGRLVPPSESEGAPAESYSETSSQSSVSNPSESTAGASFSAGAPQASFGVSGGVESSVASFGAARLDAQDSAHLESAAPPTAPMSEVAATLPPSAPTTLEGAAAGVATLTTPYHGTQPAHLAGPPMASPGAHGEPSAVSFAHLEPSATAGHRFAEVSSVHLGDGDGDAAQPHDVRGGSGDGVQERASEIFRLIRPGRSPVGGGDA